jgi:hypothetical protein
MGFCATIKVKFVVTALQKICLQGEQQGSLVYLLDVFPGLTCSRVDIDDSLPALVISQPVLLVGFTRRVVTSRLPHQSEDRMAKMERNIKGFSKGNGTSHTSQIVRRF